MTLYDLLRAIKDLPYIHIFVYNNTTNESIRSTPYDRFNNNLSIRQVFGRNLDCFIESFEFDDALSWCVDDHEHTPTKAEIRDDYGIYTKFIDIVVK